MNQMLNHHNGRRYPLADFDSPAPPRPPHHGGDPATELAATPVLWKLALSKNSSADHPFAGLRTLIVLHALGNLRAFLRAMMLKGLEPALTTVFVKPYDYGEKPQVLAWLAERGFSVCQVDEIGTDFLAGIEAEMPALPILVVEDGGYFASAMHALMPSLLSRVIGTVEQTSRGIAKLREAVVEDLARIAVPVVSVPDSTLKKGFEPPFIAAGIVRTLHNLLSRDLGEMKVLVLGYGVIGKALVERLLDAGAEITVFDPKLRHDPASLYARFDVALDPIAAAPDKDLIIGASGRQSVTPEVIDAASAGTYFASASSDQHEIAVGYFEEIAVEKEVLRHDFLYCEGGRERVPKGTTYRVLPDGRELFLIHDGRPINFMSLGSGMSDREADLVLALIYAGALELAAGAYAGQTGILANAVDGLDKKYRIGETFVRFRRPRRR
jgi:S-adenosylhomocysteine hydrolase